MTPTTVTDDVLLAIESEILAHPPERGAALLGPPDLPVVSVLLPDPDAAVTAASYIPSAGLTERVREHERHSGLQLKGVVHSHPRSLDRPSGPDHRAAAIGLEVNPHLSRYLCPIVTASPFAGGSDDLAEHELPLDGGKISWYCGRRGRDAANGYGYDPTLAPAAVTAAASTTPVPSRWKAGPCSPDRSTCPAASA